MRNPLNKRLKRDFTQNFGRYGAIAVLLFVTISLVSAFFSVASSVEKTYQEAVTLSHLEDGQFASYMEINQEILNRLAKEHNIRVYQDYFLETKEEEITHRIYNTRDQINTVALYEGALPSEKNQIAIDRLFADNNDISIGDTININNQQMNITGYVALPDYNSLFKNNTDLMMDTFTFNVAIVNDDTFNSFVKESITYNYAYTFNEKNINEKEQREVADKLKVELLQNDVTLSNFVVSYDNQAISFLMDDMGSDVPMMKVFFMIIIIIMAFVFTVIIRSTIESEAAIIGTLLASGYQKYQILIHYIQLPILVTIIAAILGNIVSNTVMIGIFEGIYYTTYSLPPLQVHFDIEAVLLTTVLPIVLMLVINILVLTKTLFITPLSFLRKELKKSRRKRNIKIPQFKFINRFRLRVILQNKGSYFMLFLGVFLASFILLFALEINPLVDHYLGEIENGSLPKYQYIVKVPVENEIGEKFNIQTVEFYNSFADKNMEVTLYGVEENSKFINNLDYHNNKNGIYVSEGVLKKANVSVGDTIIFEHPYLDESYELEILGIYDYPANLVAFMNITAFNTLLDRDNDAYAGYFADQALDIDDTLLATTITPEDLTAIGKQALSSFDSMVPLFVGAAVLIYLVLMYLLTKVVIDKNALNMSFMKIFGYTNREVRNIYLQATTIVVVGSLLISIPICYFALVWAFDLAFMEMNSYIKVVVPNYLYLITFGIGIVTYFIINYLHVKRIRHIDMSLALKDRE